MQEPLVPDGYGYIRFSSDEQSDGDSERRQMAAIVTTAKQHSLTLHMLPPDRAVSAYLGRNLRKGSLAAFIADTMAGRIRHGSWLLFEDFDRFSRAEASIAQEAMLCLVNRGIVICTTSDGRICRSGGDVTDFIVPLIKMQGAYDDNRRRAMRIKQGLVERRTKVSRNLPLTGRVPHWLTVIDQKNGSKIVSRRIEEIVARADIVRRIFALAADGYGAGAIVRKLNVEGVPTFEPNPNGWQKSYITKILNNRAVIGELQMYETERVDDKRIRHKLAEPVSDYFPRTVDFDLWRRAEAARVGRTMKKAGRPSRQAVNLFSGLCKCGACGGGMELRAKGKKGGGDYLICASYLRKAGCQASLNYPLGKLETTFFDHWSGFFGRASDFAATGNADTAEAAERLDRAEREITSNRLRLDNLMDALSEAELGEERRPIRAKIATLQAALDGLSDARPHLICDLEISQATDIQASHDEMDRITQDALLSVDATARRRLSQVLRETVQQIVFFDETAAFRPARGEGVLLITFMKGGHPKVEFSRNRPSHA